MEKNGNVHNDPKGEFTTKKILYLAINRDHGNQDREVQPNDISAILAKAKEKLFTIRQKRHRAHLDDKVITAWNGMMIGALAMGSRLLGDHALLEAATETAIFIQENL